MADTIVMIPGDTTQGTGWSAGLWTKDPTAAGTLEGSQFINLAGFGSISSTGPIQQLVGANYTTTNGTNTAGGLSAIYWGTNNLMINVGPEIHATGTQTLSQSSFTGVEFVNANTGLFQTYLTASASSYSLNSDKSATWTFADTTQAFILGQPVALYFF